MPTPSPAQAPAVAAPHKIPGSQVPFGVNEMRLNGRQWALVVVLLVAATLLIPLLWKKIERFETGPDYRIPYALSKDYWLYQRRLGQVPAPSRIPVLGDSVVWGEYVLPDGTLSHFLSGEAAETGKFVNAGVNGLFPLAMEGLARCYGQSLNHRKVIVQCNLLWMSSPKADLQTDKEEKFNHSQLVPQFSPRIPCYRADANERLGAVINRNVTFLSWVNHLQAAYFGEKSLLNWTLETGEGDPPPLVNAYKNPLAQITLQVPKAPEPDPDRGPASPRHRPWTANSHAPAQFEWVTLESSLQWGAFQRLVRLLQSRGDDVLVLLSPFNEHMIAAESKPGYQRLREGIAAWLEKEHVPHVLPAVLPSELYADASHPLTDGYALLARQLYADPAFQAWLRAR
jgi:hypothetical protein